ncbi:Aspartyl protease UND [Linum perenne]
MDTIGDLLWVKCLPCSPCSSTSGMTFFDPTKSKTFIPRQCTKGCWDWYSKKVCKYKITYFNDTISEGILAREHITFNQYEYGATNVVLPNFLVGCSNTFNQQQDEYYINGVMSIGFNNGHSLVAKLGYKFSYCIGNVVDRSYPYNRLNIGKGAFLSGKFTWLYYNIPPDPIGIYYAYITNFVGSSATNRPTLV